MDDLREKVILGIENCLTTDSVTECRKTECPFIACRESCLEWLLRSALSLLKAQKADDWEMVKNLLKEFGQQDEWAEWEPLENGIDDDTNPAYECSNCGAMCQKQHNYCPKCGKKMRWVWRDNHEPDQP